MKNPSAKATQVPGGVDLEFRCEYGNIYDRVDADGMHCSKEGCQCAINNKSAAPDMKAMLQVFDQFLK